jgi:uncharacterized protein (TIGR00299 family) protein
VKTLHFDCRAGISGDMALGALVDLGVEPRTLRRELKKLGVSGWTLRFNRTERGGLAGIQGLVELGHHAGHRPHRHTPWREIRSLIENSAISGGAKKRALDIFARIAEAEAQVHGVKTEDAAFHEIGALDSIIDVVGSAICLDLLRPERITCGAVELGGGTVACAHGILPVPAPATRILVRGMPVTAGAFNKEMTTPTGAAILASSVDEFIPPDLPAGTFRELKSGYGIGAWRTEKPNLLRVIWRESGC